MVYREAADPRIDEGEPPPSDGQGLRCPVDGSRLRVDDDGTGIVHVCARCRGAWVGHEQLRALFAASTKNGSRYGAPRDARERSLACPDCDAPLESAYLGRSGVRTDVCKLHGTWFDARELEAALSHVAAGGHVGEWPPPGILVPPQLHRAPPHALLSLSDIVADLLGRGSHAPAPRRVSEPPRGPEPKRAPSLTCPRDGKVMRAIEVSAREGHVHSCAECRGAFVPHGTVVRLLTLAEHERDPARRRTPRYAPPRDVHERAATCPECDEEMSVFYASRSGVRVDVCAADGTWFDARELASMLDYADRGGTVDEWSLAESREVPFTAMETRFLYSLLARIG